MDPSTYETLKNQTLLFFIEKLLEKSPRSLHDLSCQFGSKNFTKEMRQIAGGGQAGLRKFLLQYPSLFNLENEFVSYATHTKQKISRDYNKEAVEYFRNRLLQYGFNVRVPIKSLLGHRSQANTEIRHVSGQHINEFRDFLERNSEFVVTEEFVWLKEFEHEKITEFKEVNYTNYDKECVYKLCKFFVNLIIDKGPMLVEQLFHHVGVHFEAGEFEGIFKNPNDLGVFLKIQPQCFQVHSNLVTLSETHQMGLDILQKQANSDANAFKTLSASTDSGVISTKNPLFRKPSIGTNGAANNKIQSSNNNNVPAQTPVPLIPNNNNVNANHINQTQPQHAKTLKQRVSSILIQTLSQNTEKDYCKPTPSIGGEVTPLSSELEKSRSSILSKTSIVANKRKAKQIVDELLKHTFVALDCEGVNLGQDGRVTMVQICTHDGHVFIFDLISEGIIDELRILLESSNVLKVIHDCRNDSVNLYNQFDIKLTNIFDTQAAHIVIQTDAGTKVKNISLNNLCELYNIEINPYKDKVKSVYKHDQRYWLRRPLTIQMQSYAASDVITLSKLYPLLKEKVKDSELFAELCFEQINAHINPDEIKSRRRLRKNEGDIKELRKKLDECADLSRLVLSNREVRLIKHMGLPDSMLDQLSNSLKIAKKLQKTQASDSSSESNLTSLENTMDSGCYNNYNSNCQLDNLTSHSSSFLTNFVSSNPTNCPTTEKINSIEKLIDNIIINPIVKMDAMTQTMSTGDIVLTKVWDEDEE